MPDRVLQGSDGVKETLEIMNNMKLENKPVNVGGKQNVVVSLPLHLACHERERMAA